MECTESVRLDLEELWTLLATAVGGKLELGEGFGVDDTELDEHDVEEHRVCVCVPMAVSVIVRAGMMLVRVTTCFVELANDAIADVEEAVLGATAFSGVGVFAGTVETTEAAAETGIISMLTADDGCELIILSEVEVVEVAVVTGIMVISIADEEVELLSVLEDELVEGTAMPDTMMMLSVDADNELLFLSKIEVSEIEVVKPVVVESDAVVFTCRGRQGTPVTSSEK